MSRIAVRNGAMQALDGLPIVDRVRRIKPPALVVSTPREEALDTGYVSGRIDVRLTLEVTAYESTEDGVDGLLADVERRFANDESLGGTVRNLEFSAYELEFDDGRFNGVQSWTAIPIGGRENES